MSVEMPTERCVQGSMDIYTGRAIYELLIIISDLLDRLLRSTWYFLKSSETSMEGPTDTSNGRSQWLTEVYWSKPLLIGPVLGRHGEARRPP